VKDLAGEMFQDPKETFNFMLSLAEQMLKNGIGNMLRTRLAFG